MTNFALLSAYGWAPLLSGHTSVFVEPKSGKTVTMALLAAAAQDVIGDMLSPMTSSSGRSAPWKCTQSSSLPVCCVMISSAQMVQRLTHGTAANTLSGTSPALTLWPPRILTVLQRRRGQQRSWRRGRNGQSMVSSQDRVTISSFLSPLRH